MLRGQAVVLFVGSAPARVWWRGLVGGDGIVARMSGDEFAVVLTNVSSFDEMDELTYQVVLLIGAHGPSCAIRLMIEC